MSKSTTESSYEEGSSDDGFSGFDFEPDSSSSTRVERLFLDGYRELLSGLPACQVRAAISISLLLLPMISGR